MVVCRCVDDAVTRIQRRVIHTPAVKQRALDPPRLAVLVPLQPEEPLTCTNQCQHAHSGSPPRRGGRLVSNVVLRLADGGVRHYVVQHGALPDPGSRRPTNAALIPVSPSEATDPTARTRLAGLQWPSPARWSIARLFPATPARDRIEPRSCCVASTPPSPGKTPRIDAIHSGDWDPTNSPNPMSMAISRRLSISPSY